MTMPKFEPVAYMQLSVEEGVDTYFPRLHKPEKYNKDWWRFDPLHSADQLTEAYEAGKREQADELEAARAEIERLENQVQARDAELWGRTQKILQLEQQLAAEQAKNVGLLDFIARAQVSSGVCYCGEPMDGHSSPMSCGHSPVDMWDHAVGKLLDAPSDTSALEAIVKKAGEVMQEKCADASIGLYSEQSTFEAIHALPAVTLEDLK